VTYVSSAVIAAITFTGVLGTLSYGQLVGSSNVADCIESAVAKQHNRAKCASFW